MVKFNPLSSSAPAFRTFAPITPHMSCNRLAENGW